MIGHLIFLSIREQCAEFALSELAFSPQGFHHVSPHVQHQLGWNSEAMHHV